MNKKRKQKPGQPDEDKKFPLPVYKPEDDIYNREKEVPLQDADDLIKKFPGLPGEELDVPGSELDDASEAIGEEDEENNYYSLGGDDHDDLEENKS